MYQDLSILGYQIARQYQEVSSTMDVAKELTNAATISPGWSALITADRQRAGRGRQGRGWISAERAFLGTFVFCSDEPAAVLGGYSLAVGVAASEALSKLGCHVSLKWPNDLVFEERDSLRKVGGVLIEIEERAGLRAILVGLGINISEAPQELSRMAVSLEEISGKSIAVEQLTYALADSLSAAHKEFVTGGGFKNVRNAWEKRSCFRNGETKLTLEVGAEIVEGIYSGVSDGGAIQVIVEGGVRALHSGHITSVKL